MSPSLSDEVDVDVCIVGGGPVGLNLAYQLARFSSPLTIQNTNTNTQPISIHIIEANPKPVQETFGRATALWPRTLEILSQMGLGDQVAQQCVAVRSSASFNAKGEEVFGRGWSFMDGVEDTRFRFTSMLRQKFVEDIFRTEMAKFGVKVNEMCRFVDLVVDETVEVGGRGRVKAMISDCSAGEGREKEYVVNCRYLVGCDGSRTLVRGAAGIPSDGDRSEDQWVRMDAVLKSTTMPKPRCFGAIESPVYGNILWLPLDHGATRIGFALNEERRKQYAALNQEAFAQEAKLAVKPFEIEYERVDWASVYSVGQRVARTFWAKESVFIAGDAAHSHSSGAGQGMNAGMHDAVNLGWKLALVLTGALKEKVLETYTLERQPNSARLIKYDEDISVLVSGRLPNDWSGDPTEDPNVALSKALKEAAGFNTGLTIGFEPNLAVARDDSSEDEKVLRKRTIIPAPAIPGYRAPDVQVLTAASWEPVWLHRLMPNLARFYIVVFTGTSSAAKHAFLTLKQDIQQNEYLSDDRGLRRTLQLNGITTNGSRGVNASSTRKWPVEFLTILPHKVDNTWYELGADPLGRAYYDLDEGTAYQRYGAGIDSGAVFVVRPDGWIGGRFRLDSADLSIQIDAYLGGLLHC